MTDLDSPRNFYGRIRGKHLKENQKSLLDDKLPSFSLAENFGRGPIPVEDLGCPLWLEIGFGGGEHLAHLVRSHPEPCFIGAEPYVNGIAKLLAKLTPTDQGRVWVHDWDARELFDRLPDDCIDRCYLLYPDPWPKARHHRRRFVTPGHLQPLARVMRRGAVFHVATDIEDYVRQTIEEVPQAGFEPLFEGSEDWHRPWEGWLSTRYEQKALREGRRPHYLRYRRT